MLQLLARFQSFPFCFKWLVIVKTDEERQQSDNKNGQAAYKYFHSQIYNMEMK